MDASRQMSIARLVAEPDLRAHALAELKLALRPIRRRLRTLHLMKVRDVHQARVELRRARAAIALLRPTLEPEGRERLERRLRKLGRIWSPVRDLDVLVERSLDWTAGKRGEQQVEFLYRVAEVRKAIAQGALQTTKRRFSEQDFRARRNCLAKVAISGAIWRRQLVAEIQEILEALSVPLELDAAEPAGDLSKLHERRKRCRLLRYQLELLRTNSELDPALEFLRTAQGLLGSVQDALFIRQRIATDLGAFMGEKLRAYGLQREDLRIHEGLVKLIDYWQLSEGWLKIRAAIEANF